MFNIMIRSDNIFYRSGLQELIERALAGERSFRYEFVPVQSTFTTDQVNVLFTDFMVEVNIPKKNNSKKGSECSKNYGEKIHIPFNTNYLDMYAIVSKIKKIFKLAYLSCNDLMSEDACRIMGLKNYLQLSLTESKVLQLIGHGHNTNDISKILNCSEKTIGTHRRNAIRKLGMTNRVEFYKYASQIKDANCREAIFICL